MNVDVFQDADVSLVRSKDSALTFAVFIGSNDCADLFSVIVFVDVNGNIRKLWISVPVSIVKLLIVSQMLDVLIKSGKHIIREPTTARGDGDVVRDEALDHIDVLIILHLEDLSFYSCR